MIKMWPKINIFELENQDFPQESLKKIMKIIKKTQKSEFSNLKNTSCFKFFFLIGKIIKNDPKQENTHHLKN